MTVLGLVVTGWLAGILGYRDGVDTSGLMGLGFTKTSTPSLRGPTSACGRRPVTRPATFCLVPRSTDFDSEVGEHTAKLVSKIVDNSG